MNLHTDQYARPIVTGINYTVNGIHKTAAQAHELRKKAGEYHDTHLDGNPMRDTPLRYLAFADQVGEAAEPLLHHKVVGLSRVLGSAYIVLDILGMSHKAYHVSTASKWSDRMKAAGREAGEGMLFHSVASLLLPAVFIKSMKFGTKQVLSRVHFAPIIARRATLFSSVFSVAMLPFLSKPIDKLTDRILHKLFHPTVEMLRKELVIIRGMAKDRLVTAERNMLERLPFTHRKPTAVAVNPTGDRIMAQSAEATGLHHPKLFDTMFK